MKLKKIVSLALAGVLAVSMLAGCSNNGSSSSKPTTDTEVTTSTTALNAVKAAVENANKDFDIVTYKDLSELANKMSTELADATPQTWATTVDKVLKGYYPTGKVTDAGTALISSKADELKAGTEAAPTYVYKIYELDSKVTGMTSVAWEAMEIAADLVQMPLQNGSTKDMSYTVSTFEFTGKKDDGTAVNQLIVLVKAEAEA